MTVFKSKPRYLRLLPGVVLICAALFALKISGLVHEAFGQEAGAALGALTPPPQAANQDFAGATTEVASAAEVDVLTSLSKRRAELDARENQIQSEANVLAATEARVDAKIAQLKDLQTQISTLLTQRDADQEKQIAALVKTYSGMKAAKAAPIFAALPDEVQIPVAQEMKSDVLGEIMANMSPDAAQKLTVKLASTLALPQTNGAATPVAAATPANGPAATPASPPAAAPPAKANAKG